MSKVDGFVAWMQSRLTAHGFSVGPVDGINGPVTVAALRAFQTRHGLNASGTGDAQTVAALRASASALTPSEAAKVPDRTIKNGHLVGEPNNHAEWPRQVSVPGVFGKPGEGIITVEVPFAMSLAWDKSIKVRRISCHELVAPSTVRILERTAVLYNEREREAIGISVYGGGFNIRKMRGGQSLSMHSYGIAFDFDPERNQLRWNRGRARLAQDDAVPFWELWEDEGWISLGRERDFDWMHVQAARL